MDISRHKKFLLNLVDDVNQNLVLEPLEFGSQNNAAYNMRLHSKSRGSLWLLARKQGFSVGLRLVQEHQKKMFNFLQTNTGRSADGFHHSGNKQPYWNIYDWEIIRKAAYELAEVPSSHINGQVYPDQAEAQHDNEGLWEGAIERVNVNRFERDPKARQRCIDHHGVSCAVCEFNFGDYYGELGEGFIHVHHLKPLSEVNAQTQTNPTKDLVPVCPNCHAMLHRKSPALTPAELKRRISLKMK